MTTQKPEPQRNDAVTIDMVEGKTKTDKSGQFYRIKGADGTWYSCFEHPLNPAPASGQVWACNIKKKGEWTNLHDMLFTGEAEAEPVQMPAGNTQKYAEVPAAQPAVTHQNMRPGTDRETRITELACIKAAAAACHIDMTNDDTIKTGAESVLKVADIFIDRVLR